MMKILKIIKTKEEKVKKKEWMHCDVVIRFLTDKLQQPKQKVDLGENLKVQIVPAMQIIPCAILSGMPHDLAMAELRKYFMKQNPKLKDEDLGIEQGWDDHAMTQYPKKSRIIFITPKGCTLGSPKS